jgi:ABC-type dipeptide/oligopeptide/nickel transport system permease subunit
LLVDVDEVGVSEFLIAAGFLPPRKADDRTAITAVFDIVNAFPPLILAFALITLYGKGSATFVLLPVVSVA